MYNGLTNITQIHKVSMQWFCIMNRLCDVGQHSLISPKPEFSYFSLYVYVRERKGRGRQTNNRQNKKDRDSIIGKVHAIMKFVAQT